MKKGFTLIELLIVVAIIAILAAIAVPNFLEAQTRSKISRTKADMRTQATAMEAYIVDANSYPPCHTFGITLSDGTSVAILERLSTPVAYVTSALAKDPFTIRGRYSAGSGQAIQAVSQPTPVPSTDPVAMQNSYIYVAWNSEQRVAVNPLPTTGDMKPRAWLLHSCGADGNYYNLGGVLAVDGQAALQYDIDMIYDSTNGTLSRGSIWRSGGAASATPGGYQAGEGLVLAMRTQR